MKSVLLTISLLYLGALAHAGNIKIETTESNCRKVDGFASDDRIAIATNFKVPVSSVRFLEAKWQRGQFGTLGCVFIIDTAKGPKQCSSALGLVSSDGGKTAFGILSNPYPSCRD